MASDLEGDTTVGCTGAVLAFTEGKDSSDAVDVPSRYTGCVIMDKKTSGWIRDCYLPPGIRGYTRHSIQLCCHRVIGGSYVVRLP